MNRAARALPRWLNGMSLIYAAWACGLLGLIGVDLAVAVGGALLLAAAGLVVLRPNDRLVVRFRRAGVSPTRFIRLFVAVLLAAVGAVWIVWALA